jgi:Flp pilus assembly protein TadD
VKPRRSKPNPLHHRRWWFVAGSAVLLLLLILILLLRTSPPPPPAVNTTGFDPAIAERITQAREAVLGSPRSAEARGRLGMVLLAHEIRAEARECFVQASALDPNEPRWLYYLALSQLVDNPMAAVPNLDRAVLLFSNPDPSRNLTPPATAARLLLADTLLNLGRLDEAEAHYRYVWDRNTNSAPAALGLGKIANTRDGPAQAVEFLNAATHHPATRKAAHRLLLSAYQRLGRTNEVARLAPIVIRLPGDEAMPDPLRDELEQLKTGERASIDLADEWINAGRAAEAAQLLEKTIQAYPRSDRAMFFLGRARLRLGDPAGAETILLRAVELAPRSVEAHVQLGVIQLTRGRPKDAQRSFWAAIQAKPNIPEAWFNLGLSLSADNRPEAITAFRQAIRLRPNLTEAYLGLALVLRAEGKNKEAADELRRALALNPDEPVRQKLFDQLKLTEHR